MDLFDVEAAERVESELDRIVEKRSREKRGANAVEEFWTEQDHRDRARRRDSYRQEWVDFHGHMNRLHLGLAAEHAAKRSRLMLEGGFEPPSPEAAGPVVRSTWQRHMQQPSPEDHIQDTPGSHRFGSANVSDKPASVETSPNVVIPRHVADKRDMAG